jgi:hypothetical protein
VIFFARPRCREIGTPGRAYHTGRFWGVVCTLSHNNAAKVGIISEKNKFWSGFFHNQYKFRPSSRTAGTAMKIIKNIILKHTTAVAGGNKKNHSLLINQFKSYEQAPVTGYMKDILFLFHKCRRDGEESYHGKDDA